MTRKAKPPGAGMPQAAATETSRSPAAITAPPPDGQVSDRCAGRREKPEPPTIPRQLVKIAEEFGVDFAADIVMVARLLAADPRRCTLYRLGFSERDYLFREVLGRLVDLEQP